MLGEVTREQELALREYGFNLGIAFQLVDDLLDYTADETALGKPVGGDLREGKVTLPAIYLLQQDGGMASELIRGVVRDRMVTPESWQELSRLLTEHRALDRAYGKAVEYAAIAKQYLAVFPPTPERDALMALPDYVLSRDR